MITRFLRDEAGATALEYALIGGLISIVIIAAVMNVGETVSGMFQEVADGFPE